MVLLKALVKNKLYCSLGFNLIEVIIILAIFSSIISIGMIVDFDFYFLHLFESDKSRFLSFLYKTRSQSLNNINNTKHGLCVDQDSPNKKIILFDGDSFSGSVNQQIYEINQSSYFESDKSHLFCKSGKGIIFERLSAKTEKIKITLYFKERFVDINISDEGVIE